MVKWLACAGAPESVHQPTALPVCPGHFVLQAVALSVVEPINGAVHAPLERDAFHLKAAFGCVPKVLQRCLARCSIRFAPLLYKCQVAG